MTTDPRLHRIVASQPYPLVFATISGAHLYGFPSPDSDFDLRGSHLLPLPKVVGLDVTDETIEDSRVIELPSDATRAALDDLLIRTRLAGRA
jgi:predicted nucleotidyltransferase